MSAPADRIQQQMHELGVRPLDPGRLPPGVVVVRGLFLPSFAGPTLIELRENGPIATLSLRGWGPDAAPLRPGFLADRHSEIAVVRRAAGTPMWRQLQGPAGPELEAAPRSGIGIDGMTVRVEVLLDGALRAVDDWSPRPGTPVHRALATLFTLASCNLRDPRSQRQLDGLQLHLEGRGSARDRGGRPRRLRLFGDLHRYDVARLQAIADGIPPDDALLIEVEALESADDPSLAALRRIAARPGPTAWWAGTEERAAWLRGQLPEAAVFVRLDRAMANLGGG
ncbi:MAG: hypothetical protein H6739_27940 [Alphaproteobacteria bacterium]|nr:hypothetical protein [Alphaproteobacteria bacterium]